MLISFSVGNFRSFCAEQTLSLAGSNRLAGSHPQHAASIPDSDQSVLRCAVLYGANGAGKSNLFRAMRYATELALKPRPHGSKMAREPFRMGDDTGVSSFDFVFATSGRVFRYGFKVDDSYVVEEWFVQKIRGREKIIFERSTNKDGKVLVEFSDGEDAQKVATLASIGGPSNQTFLATIKATIAADEMGINVKALHDWLQSSLRLIGPDENIVPVGHFLSSNAKFMEFAGKFLKESSTGISSLSVDKKSLTRDELSALLPSEFFGQVIRSIDEGENKRSIINFGDSQELILERKDTDNFYSIRINAAHEILGSEPVSMALEEESDGTKRLLQLAPALFPRKRRTVTYFIDEIDRSLHPLLVWKYLEFFLKSCSENEGQILVTTHESNLLDLDLLRRDEIWFAEKDAAHATQIYSLSDFRVRQDADLRKHYLQGRFGAIPFTGQIDRLLASENATS